MIQRAFHWLEKHRTVNLVMVVAYAIFLLFAHDMFVSLSVGVMNSLSLPIFQKVVAVIVVLFALAMAVTSWFVLRKGSADKRTASYFAASLLLLVVHFFVFTEMNVEFIHALMYGGLAVLLFPLIGRLGGAIVLCLPLMLVDEWYQHVILFPHYTYFFEFNDIVLDLLGAGLFVSMLRLLGMGSERAFAPPRMRSEVWLLFAVAVILIAVMATCIIVPYSEDACSNTWFVLNKLPEMSEFWYVHPVIGSTFHILKPIEGIVLMFLLCVAYVGMDSVKSAK
ncbi:MAG: hypothetical protein K9G46_03885 [Flavobacteriales bacterium]|nr:hypothetical protein [Flavobacteriales bacterium]